MKSTTRLRRKHDGKVFFPTFVGRYCDLSSDDGEIDIVRHEKRDGAYDGLVTHNQYVEITVFPSNTRRLTR